MKGKRHDLATHKEKDKNDTYEGHSLMKKKNMPWDFALHSTKERDQKQKEMLWEIEDKNNNINKR